MFIDSEELELLLHDTIGPLASIQMQAEAFERRAARGAVDAAECAHAFRDICFQAAHLAARLRSGMDTASVHAHRPADEISIADCLAKTVASFSEPERARLDVAVDPLLPLGRWDPDLIERLLRNLVENALKYGTPDRQIRVLGTRRGDATVTISVSNEGQGLDGEDLEALFRPYTRTASARHRASGRGLGLYGSRRIAMAYGGRLWADREGERATFTLELPVGRPEADVLPQRNEVR